MLPVRPCAPNSHRGTGAAESDADDAGARVRKLKLVSEYLGRKSLNVLNFPFA